jgi:hypothetical protein
VEAAAGAVDGFAAPEGAAEAGIIRFGTMPNGDARIAWPEAMQWVIEFCSQICGADCSVVQHGVSARGC